MDDKALIDRCIADPGDMQAFEELILRYERKIVAAAIRLCANREEGEDLAQETFLRAWRALPGYRGQASFSTWLIAILSNLWKDRLRRARPQESYDELTEGADDTVPRQFGDEQPGPDSMAEQGEEKAVLGAMIDELTPEFREALVLRDVHGYSYEEVAVITGTNLGTVKSRINRARTQLRAKIISYQEQFPGFFRLSVVESDEKAAGEAGGGGTGNG